MNHSRILQSNFKQNKPIEKPQKRNKLRQKKAIEILSSNFKSKKASKYF